MAEEKKPSEGPGEPGAEMRKLADEVEKEKKEGEGKPPEEEKKPEEKPKEEVPPKETPKKEEEEVEVIEELEEEEKKEARPSKFVPLPKFLKEKDKWKEKESELLGRIAELEKGGKKEEAAPAEIADLEKEITAIADETGADPDFSLKLGRAITKHLQAGQKIPQEIIERIIKLEELQKDKFEATAFDEEFHKDVEPLLETEGIAKDRWAKVKKIMETLAFTEEYAKLPLKQIWRLAEFDELRIKGKKSGEGSGAGIRAGEAGEEKPVTEMPDKEFDEWYGKNVEADKGKTTVITRGGKKIK